MESVDVVVIGAGVVGLAVARALARRGREVFILESLPAYGTVTSARNSEVVHAGLYYPTGSLKARWCVSGRRELVARCAEWGVPLRVCGKLIVAVDESDEQRLLDLHRQGLDNGVEGLRLLSGAQANALEPELKATAALHSTVTGIVDSHALMTALLAQAQAHGAQMVLHSPVEAGEALPDGGWRLRVGGRDPMDLRAGAVVNAAGLEAPALARRMNGVPPQSIPQERLCKGNYFALQGRAPFSRLIYPLHNAAGLGTHLTLDWAGQARFGPDVQWLPAGATPDYAVDPARAATFERDIRRWWPGMPTEALIPAYSGIRPKICGPGEPPADFRLSTPDEHGVAGWWALYGIESPGLTACLALADHLAQQMHLV